MKHKSFQYCIVLTGMFCLFAISCQKEDYVISPSTAQISDPTIDQITSEAGLTNHSDSTDFAIYNILQVQVSPVYVRGGLESPSNAAMDNESNDTPSFARRYKVIDVRSGPSPGFTDDFGRCATTFDMHFNTVTHHADGIVQCKFDLTGDVIEFALRSNGPIQEIPQFDGPHQALIMEVEVTRATGVFAGAHFDMLSYFLNAQFLLEDSMQSFNTYFMITGTVDM